MIEYGKAFGWNQVIAVPFARSISLSAVDAKATFLETELKQEIMQVVLLENIMVDKKPTFAALC